MVMLEDDEAVRYINLKNGQTSAFFKARKLKYAVVIAVCRELGVPVPLEVSVRPRSVTGVKGAPIRRKIRV